MINPLNTHYSFTNPASVHDEEALTALELAGRTTAKVNEVVADQNALRQETEKHLDTQDKTIDDRMDKQDADIENIRTVTVPADVTAEVAQQIENGTFDAQINAYTGNLKERVDNLAKLQEGSTTGDAELIDGRVDSYGVTHKNIGGHIRRKTTPSELTFVPVVTKRKAVNKLSKYNLIPGYYVDTEGVIRESESFNLSEKIDVSNYKSIFCCYVSNSVFYSADGQAISAFQAGASSIDVPENASFVRFSVINGNLDKCGMYPDADTQGINDKGMVWLEDALVINNVKMWYGVTVKGYEITFPATTVFQSNTGVFLLIQADAPKTYKLGDGDILYLDFDFSVNKIVKDFDNIKQAYDKKLVDNETFLCQRIANNPLITNMQRIQEALNDNKYSVAKVAEIPPTPTVKQSLSELAPVFYRNHKGRRKDMTVVLIGDSISTANYYAEPRTDAKYRPPLMTEKCFPSYIEEWLRWDGQVYNRFDVAGVFTEVCDSAESLEYDVEHWDWESNNNRPAITRCLSGSNCSVSFPMETTYLRTDYIYRTDCTNADSMTVVVSTGDGFVLVYDESTGAWVEANNYTLSAKESAEPIDTPFGSLMKSIYQKRLKFKWKNAKSSTNITIRNNGAGRLTYWGVQRCRNDVSFNFILSARGGHSIGRLEQFEQWDVDYWKPDLILWELPIMNHRGVDIVNSEWVSNHELATPTTFAQPFIVKCDQLLAKDYNPEVICFPLWTADNTVHSIDGQGAWLFGMDTDYKPVSTKMYVDELVYSLMEKVPVLDMTSLYHLYGFTYMEWVGVDSYREATTVGSGRDGNTWTIDGGHFNTRGALITAKLFGDFFKK